MASNRGRKRWKPTDEERRRVRTYAGLGITQEQIASLVGKCVDTLARHCREELDVGAAEAKAKVGGAIVKAALKGNMSAAIFYAKTQMGWKETSVQEHTGRDGGPIDIRALNHLTDEELEQLERITSKLAIAGANNGGQ